MGNADSLISQVYQPPSFHRLADLITDFRGLKGVGLADLALPIQFIYGIPQCPGLQVWDCDEITLEADANTLDIDWDTLYLRRLRIMTMRPNLRYFERLAQSPCRESFTIGAIQFFHMPMGVDILKLFPASAFRRLCHLSLLALFLSLTIPHPSRTSAPKSLEYPSGTL